MVKLTVEEAPDLTEKTGLIHGNTQVELQFMSQMIKYKHQKFLIIAN